MNRFRDLSKAVSRVTLSDLAAYLLRSGWKRSASRNDRWKAFTLAEDGREPIEVLLPAESRYVDTARRIAETLRTLEQIENRPIPDVAADIVGGNSDSLLIRLAVPGRATSIPIAEASRQVRAIRNLITYSGCSELEPKAYYEQPSQAALNLLIGFDFCHTFEGSFGFEIVNVLAKPQQAQDLFEAPIQRRMVERIARGMILLEQSSVSDDPAPLIQAYETAFNARMCDALTDIALDGQVEFDLGIDWAISLLPAEDVLSFRSGVISEKKVDILLYVSEQLKIVVPRHDRIHGSVINLHCAANPVEGKAKRTIALRVEHPLHKTIEVKITLGPDSYLLAIEAHSSGKKLAATGLLQRNGSIWSLEAVSELFIA